MFTPTGFLYFPLPFTRNFGQYQQMARLCTMIIPLKAILKHPLVQAIGSQNYKIFTGTFYVIFLKWYFTILLSSHEHLTARRQNTTSMTSLDIFALLSLFMNPVFWGQVAHEHFCNVTWVGYEMALLGAGRPTLPGPNNRGQYTAPPNRWFMQW